MACEYGIKTCLCHDCARNAAWDGCQNGYCIDCFECEKAGKSVHNVYLCTGYEEREVIPMKKLFISQPMRGKTPEEIQAVRERAIESAKNYLKETGGEEAIIREAVQVAAVGGQWIPGNLRDLQGQLLPGRAKKTAN